MSAIFENILGQALELNLQRQAVNARTRHHLEPHLWLQEYGSVRVHLGRGAGHSTAIRNLATDHDLIVAGSQFTVMTMRENAAHKPVVISKIDYNSDSLRGRSFSRIWVDDASLMKSDEIRNVFVLAVIHRVEQVIFVG